MLELSLVIITVPFKSVLYTLTDIAFNFAKVSCVGWPYRLPAPALITAILGFTASKMVEKKKSYFRDGQVLIHRILGRNHTLQPYLFHF